MRITIINYYVIYIPTNRYLLVSINPLGQLSKHNLDTKS